MSEAKYDFPLLKMGALYESADENGDVEFKGYGTFVSRWEILPTTQPRTTDRDASHEVWAVNKAEKDDDGTIIVPACRIYWSRMWVRRNKEGHWGGSGAISKAAQFLVFFNRYRKEDENKKPSHYLYVSESKAERDRKATAGSTRYKQPQPSIAQSVDDEFDDGSIPF